MSRTVQVLSICLRNDEVASGLQFVKIQGIGKLDGFLLEFIVDGILFVVDGDSS